MTESAELENRDYEYFITMPKDEAVEWLQLLTNTYKFLYFHNQSTLGVGNAAGIAWREILAAVLARCTDLFKPQPTTKEGNVAKNSVSTKSRVRKVHYSNMTD